MRSVEGVFDTRINNNTKTNGHSSFWAMETEIIATSEIYNAFFFFIKIEFKSVA